MPLAFLRHLADAGVYLEMSVLHGLECVPYRGFRDMRPTNVATLRDWLPGATMRPLLFLLDASEIALLDVGPVLLIDCSSTFIGSER